MKKIILLLVVLAIVFIVVEREKLYVRDPLATVTRNGVKESGAQVFINVNNDVLIENDNPPLYAEFIQHSSPIGIPAKLTCLHWLACLADAAPATLLLENPGSKLGSMDAKTVTFTDSGKRETIVTLR